MSQVPVTLTTALMDKALTHLSAADPDLSTVITTLGSPPMWAREPGFATLVHIILEQQVSLASALAAFDKLQNAVDELTPKQFLTFDDAELKTIGFSRQKTLYCRELAKAIETGRLNLDELAFLDDASVRTHLTQIKGIGPWTANIYLLMVLLRPDIWPSGDIALAEAVRQIKKLDSRPGTDALSGMAAGWKPWRAVAARVLWQHYLS